VNDDAGRDAYGDGYRQGRRDQVQQLPRLPNLWGWDTDPNILPELRAAYERGYRDGRADSATGR
jgi:hypothetical protein